MATTEQNPYRPPIDTALRRKSNLWARIFFTGVVMAVGAMSVHFFALAILIAFWPLLIINMICEAIGKLMAIIGGIGWAVSYFRRRQNG